MSDKCCIPEFKMCCCTCVHHIQDFHHCTTAPEMRMEGGADRGCVCSIPKGWICRPPEFDGRAYSGWSEHGICEMHTPRQPLPGVDQQ